ncbi:MAG: tRNA guanosine(34) transglycosylase Tgt [Anaerolineae bacterium]|jgi:queuine tRNA-ribosyltransferase
MNQTTGEAFSFALEAVDGQARAGLLHTPHGAVPTPVFCPVGTHATVKAASPRDLHDLGATQILANAYHLHLRPGDELIAQLGGLHMFMGWDGPILTDSGGYQVFSLAERREVDADGVTFRSHIDGAEERFTPESVVAIQENLGADLITCLDECAEPFDYEYSVEAMERTHAWAERCKAAKSRPDQALFGIVQGGIFPDLRERSAQYLTALGFDHYAIGGLSVGETKDQMHAILELMDKSLPRDKVRYLMGVGTPQDLVECTARGVDMFDCVLPTRMARNGGVLTRAGRLSIRNARFADDARPLEPGCTCYACTSFSRAYLRHLNWADEILGHQLITIHNLHLMLTIAREIRESILAGRFQDYRAAFWEGRQRSDG